MTNLKKEVIETRKKELIEAKIKITEKAVFLVLSASIGTVRLHNVGLRYLETNLEIKNIKFNEPSLNLDLLEILLEGIKGPGSYKIELFIFYTEIGINYTKNIPITKKTIVEFNVLPGSDEKTESVPRKQLTDTEKIAAFDRIADACAEFITSQETYYREDSDAEAAIKETALTEVYGEDIFEIIERLLNEYNENDWNDDDEEGEVTL